MGLRKWQWNKVFKAIEDAGLSPEEFDREIGSSESNLRHLPSGAYFVFGGGAGRYVSRYKAGDSPAEEERTKLSEFGLMQQVQFWLSELKLDIDTPDLWAQLRGNAELFGFVSAGSVENTPFTTAEQEEIAKQLRELKDRVSSAYSLSESQVLLLGEKLDNLAAAAGRVGRKDWVLMAAGLMLSYVLSAALPPEAARDILGMLITSIGHILGPGPLGLPG